ncbi:MAG: flagellar biosynthesis protein FlgA [Chloroflexota bacterium]|nr:flagellar biosynthesis protein FlgA [Chloroflexota bacterium]
MLRLLLERLEARAAAGRPVTVALAGAGRFGTSVAAQIAQIDGLRLAAVADPNAGNGVAALTAAGWAEGQWRRCEDAGEARGALEAGASVLAPDAEVLESAPIDVLVEATGIPEVAARNALHALRQGRHVVMVTVEADVSCGWALAREARRQEVVYSLAAGDQPVAIMELFDWAKALGLEIVAVGRGTRRYPADRHGDPERALARLGYDAEASARLRLNAQMYNSFRDGSKAQIEMCAVSNMTGLPPDRRGMHEPSVGLGGLPDLFAPSGDGGLLESSGVVDLANGVGADGESELPENIADGVWAVVTSADGHIREDMRIHGTRVSSDGRRMALFREYHLCGIETPLSIAQAALLGASSGLPHETPTSEVLAYAKHDLRPGDRLDGSGGRLVYGLIDRAEVLAAEGVLPLGLSYGARVREAVAADQPIPAGSVAMDEESFVANLRSMACEP